MTSTAKSSGPVVVHDLGAMRFFVVGTYFKGPEVVAAFVHEGMAAAFLDLQAPTARKSLHLEDREGVVVENVRYRENYGGTYGHAMAIAQTVTQAERDRLKPKGYNFSDTGISR
jgi:hypothetical protein